MFACRAAEGAAEESSIAPKHQGRKKAPKGPKEIEMFQLTAAASIANASVTDKVEFPARTMKILYDKGISSAFQIFIAYSNLYTAYKK
jgi:hypothetical protein